MDGLQRQADQDLEAEASEPIRCAHCDAEIAPADALLPLRGAEPVQVHANPHGIVFEVVTLAVAPGALARGPASTDFSWFAGYAWSLAHCGGCRVHLGWRFDAVAGASPRRFWGLVKPRLTGV